jgi:hypothetical protein
MHPFLTGLSVAPAVQEFFEPYYSTDETGDLVFSYGETAEHFGFAFHRVPACGLWQAGNPNTSMIRYVFLCDSAMEAIAYFSLNLHGFPHPALCLFIAGDLEFNFIGKSCALVFSNDLLGRVRDLKTAAVIRRQPLAITVKEETVLIRFRQSTYEISQEQFSLSAFEKLTGYRFGMRVNKAKNAPCWLDQLKSNI